MRRKSRHSELPKKVNITVAPRKRFKDECDDCGTYKFDVHSYYDSENIAHILCEECAKKNKLIVRNWKNEPIEREDNNDKNKNSKKTRTKKSAGENNTNSSNTENGSKDSGQLLHDRVSRRKRSSEQSEHRPRTRKTKSV